MKLDERVAISAGRFGKFGVTQERPSRIAAEFAAAVEQRMQPAHA
jgi:hypothetical protein